MESWVHVGAVGRGALWGLVSALVLTGLAALLLSFTQHPAQYMPMTMVSVGWVSVLLSGVFAGRSAGRGGLVHGAMGGLLFLVLALSVGTLIFDVPLLLPAAAIRGGIAVVVGATGGALGVAL